MIGKSILAILLIAVAAVTGHAEGIDTTGESR